MLKRAIMSDWDEDLEPEEKRRRQWQDPETADRLIAADGLLIAALKKNPVDIDGLRAALAAEACPDRIVVNGLPALHVAIHKQDLAVLDLLLRHGARTDDIDAQGAVALDEAYRRRFREGIDLLRRFGAETRQVGGEPPDLDDIYAPSYQSRVNGFLFEMVRKGTARQVGQALALGADPNAEDTHARVNFPPLHLAVARCDMEKVEKLLAAGADIFARNGYGEEVADMIWYAPREKLFTPEWFALFDGLYERGYNNLFVKHPADLTLDDLRRPVPGGGTNDASLLHYLVHMGHADFVFGVLEKNPAERLTAADLLKKSRYHVETLLEAFNAHNLLPRLFSADLWQDRLDEMLTLRPLVEKNILMRGRLDFNKAAAEITARRLKDASRAAPRLQPKGRNHDR
jgi:ankyrin repeat protein